MVVPNPKSWIHDIGILAFEMAAAMSRLVSLHRMVSDAEILKLRSDTMRSQGVAYLNSTDQALLISIACAELIEDLDRTAEVVSRFCQRCQGPLPVGFDRVYTDLKTGSIDPNRLGINFAGKRIEKRMKKMEKYISTASKLYEQMEILADLEATERKKWGRHSGPIPIQKPNAAAANDSSLKHDIKTQLQRVRKLKEESLWNQTFDKAVELMASACYSTFARICVVFSPYVSGLPRIVVNKETSRLFFASSHLKFRIHPRSGPLEPRPATKEVAIRNSCPIIRTRDSDTNSNKPVEWSKMLEPAPNTIGRAGLALRYANIIVLAERVMMDGEAEAEKEELYEMLPMGLRSAVRAKLRDRWRERGPLDGSLADGWKDAVWRIFEWLGPIAHDTMDWQSERSMDRRQRFEYGPRKFLLQTLHFADKVKTEAAITEVLVGLSLVCWYDEQCRNGSYRYSY